MADENRFWELEHLSDSQLLESLRGVLRTKRQALAELVAHLAEVEDRRLHLEAACSSMFVYCVERLGMSEDEACRRIELARLARRFPALFTEIGSGRMTLSVALVLKPVLSPGNHLELLTAARGKCIRQARELVAELFPKPDAPSTIRKLPERRAVGVTEPARTSLPAAASPQPTPKQPDVPASSPPTFALAQATLAQPTLSAASAVPEPFSAAPPGSEPLQLAVPSHGSVPAASHNCIEPLSAQRYRIQFTADLDLKKKLELACNLLRHAHPGGDFAPVVSRALDLLLDELLRRRFGANVRRKGPGAASSKAARMPSAASASAGPCDALEPSDPAQAHPNISRCGHPARARPTSAVAEDSCTSALASQAHASAPAPAKSARANRCAPPRAAPVPAASACASAPFASASAPTPAARYRPHVPRAARRAALERDGLGCSWLDAHGVCCGSQAWLEIDHREPRGKGGSSEPDNLRLLCRAHNRLAAERVYGREHIERMSTRRQPES